MSALRALPVRALLAAIGALAALSPCALPAADLAFRHDPPDCLAADGFPRLVAQLDPAEEAARVRLAFRPEAASAWHRVEADAAEGGFAALLPRPRTAARRVHYRFEAITLDAVRIESQEYSAAVVADRAACPGEVAASVPSASVVVEVPPGAPLVPPVPAGFDPVGAVSSTAVKPAGGGRRKMGVVAGVVIGAAAAGGAIAATQSETTPVPLQPIVWVRSSSPALFQEVSVSRNSMTAEISVVISRYLQAGEAWFVLHNPTNPPERPCAVLTGRYPPMEPGRAAVFVVRTPFVTASACGLAHFGRIQFRGSGGQTLYSSGGAELPDASVAYTFVP